MSERRLAVLGGEPAFPNGLPFVTPVTPQLERVMARLRPSYDRGMLTNGPLVRELEGRMADRLGVRHAVAVASCTAGLMLGLRALRATGRVVLPSFTFSATAHAVVWNGATPVFAECDASSFQLDAADVERRMEGATVVIANHVFGSPAPTTEIERVADANGARVLYDAAGALGARRGGRSIGSFGALEVFSMSPTKTVIAGEGGLVTTDDDEIAETIRIGRDYGHAGDYDTQFVGLNARLSELHAALALESLEALDDTLNWRTSIAERYRAALSEVPGVAVQAVESTAQPTWKDLGIVLDPGEFGVARDLLAGALRAEGIDTRPYFSPPVHLQHAYRHLEPTDLPVTEHVAARVLCLPLSAGLSDDDIDLVAERVQAVGANAAAVANVAPDA